VGLKFPLKMFCNGLKAVRVLSLSYCGLAKANLEISKQFYGSV